MEYTPHAPSLRVLNNTSIRVTWNHKSCPKDATLCCVFGRNIKSTGGKFKTAIPKTGTLENDNPDKKYFLVGNGFADVKNLVLNETYEFKLVFYCKKTDKWGRNGTCSRIKMSLLPPAPVLQRVSNSSITVRWAEIIPENVTFVCVWGKISGSSDKFSIADSSQAGNALVAQSSSNKHHNANSGSVVISKGLKTGTKYEFKLTWYDGPTKKWGKMGSSGYVTL